MAVESIFTPKEERKAAAKWANGMKDDFETMKRELSRQAKKWMVRAATWLLEQMKKNGAWTYNRSGNADVNRVNVTGEKGFIMLKRTDEGNMSGFRWDHSNTQYALLGLHSASRCGVLIHNNNWKWMLSHWLKTQADTGPKVDLKRDGMSKNGNETGVGDGQARARHWVYQPDDKKHTNKFEMTAGGVGSVAIALHHLENQGGANEAVRTKATKSIRDGLAWLQKNWNKYPNSSLAGRGGFGDYYTLYGLERTMMLTATNTLNDHDWYVEGAKAILKEQNSDGSWRGRGEHTGKKSALAETCFALLFLKRATLPVTTGH